MLIILSYWKRILNLQNEVHKGNNNRQEKGYNPTLYYVDDYICCCGIS